MVKMIIIIKKVYMFSFDENLAWQQQFTKVYLESVELLLTLVFSVEELQMMVCIDLKDMRSAECYHRATKYIYQNQEAWDVLDSSLQKRLEPWIFSYRDKTPVEICTLLSQKDREVDIREISALLWSLLYKGVECPAKIYRYAYHRCRYLFRRKCTIHLKKVAIA